LIHSVPHTFSSDPFTSFSVFTKEKAIRFGDACDIQRRAIEGHNLSLDLSLSLSAFPVPLTTIAASLARESFRPDEDLNFDQLETLDNETREELFDSYSTKRALESI